MNARCTPGWICALWLGLSAGAQAQGEGLSANPSIWPRWQARVSVGLPSLGGAARLGDLAQHAAVVEAQPATASLGVLGDYFLSRPSPGASLGGGLRASGGVFFGPRTGLWLGPAAGAASRGGMLSVERRTLGATSMAPRLPGDVTQDTGPTPYVGLGYTGLSSSGRWGYSADLGLLAAGRSGVRLGRGLTGGQALDEAIRDLRWSPVLQLGISYSF